MTTISLQGKTIAVVGAAGRLGNEIVRALLEADANVVAVDQSESALASLQAPGATTGNLICTVGNITSAESIMRAMNLAHARFGAVDGAVNTAYPRNANYGRSFLDVSYDDFCENLSLHLGGYFLFMQQCFKYAAERKAKFSLVSLSSIYGLIAPRFDIYSGTEMTMPVEYAAIKSGVVHLTHYANAFAKGKGLRFRANCVSPGGILASQDARFLQKYNSYCQSKGMLDARDTVGAVMFLLSDAAEYVTGQNIVVDDGFCL